MVNVETLANSRSCINRMTCLSESKLLRRSFPDRNSWLTHIFAKLRKSPSRLHKKGRSFSFSLFAFLPPAIMYCAADNYYHSAAHQWSSAPVFDASSASIGSFDEQSCYSDASEASFYSRSTWSSFRSGSELRHRQDDLEFVHGAESLPYFGVPVKEVMSPVLSFTSEYAPSRLAIRCSDVTSLPKIEELRGYSQEDLCQVHGFSIGKQALGSVRITSPIDLRGISFLDDCFQFVPGWISLSKRVSASSPLRSAPAVVTVLQCWPCGRGAPSDSANAAAMRLQIEKRGGTLLSYDGRTGACLFDIPALRLLSVSV